MDEGSPTVGRRRLALDLRRRRIAAGATIDDIARHLECSPAKVSRMETGAVGVRLQDMRAVADFYGLPERERDELLGLVRQARTRGWWHAFADVVPPGSGTFYGLEDGCATIDQHVVSLVPGLFQTPRYARALLGSVPGAAEEVVRRRAELRLRRQAILDRPRAPVLSVVLDEAVLCRPVGGPDVMAEQLEHVLALGRRPAVTCRVVPFAAGVHPAIGVGFTVFGFGDPELPPVVYGEQLSRNAYVDAPDEVAIYTEALSATTRVALEPEPSHELIASYARGLRGDR